MDHYVKMSEYLKWLGKRMTRKYKNKEYTLFEDGTESEINKTAKKIENSYDILTAVETIKYSDGTTKDIHLLYVSIKPYKSFKW